MKKIGICTLYYQNRNYGANLQAYALRYTLEKLGVNAELVPYYYRTRVRRLLSSIKQSLKKNSISKNVEKRNRVIDEFNNLIPHSKVYYSNTIHKANKYYDCFITGSDQVWNPDWINKYLSLDFVEDGKVTASINGEDITLTVPYSYVDGKTFFFDFTVSDGATLKLHSTPYYPVYSSGLKTYNAATGKLVTAAAGFTSNPDFQIKKDASDNNKVKVYYTDDKTWNLNDNAYLQVVAEDGTTTKDYKIKEVKVADAEKGAEITALKANNTNATISGKNINVTLPYGTNLGQVKLAITASKMAKVDFNEYDPTDPDKTYVLTSPLSIKVVSEDGNTTNVYTLKATVASKFVDVPEDAWYYDYVMAAAKAGIVNGKENSRFDPEGAVSRRDFALMLTRMLGVDVSGYTNTPFNDVKADDYALGAIAYCAENGIVGGDGKGNFLPDSSITREEAAKMIAVAKELTGTTTEKFKDDAKISNWAKGYVDACKAAGIFGGDEKGNFNPKSPITRAETAKIMVVAMDK